MKVKIFEQHIKKASKDQLEEYSSLKATEDDVVGGNRNKRFVRFSSDLFNDLIDELQNNPNCSYDTYLNELIKEGYTPEFVSVLMKDENRHVVNDDEFELGHLKEPIASKMLNYFGCSTTFDTLIKLDGQIKSCSVDFNKEGEDLYLASEIKPHCGIMGWDFENVEYFFYKKIEQLCKDLGFEDNFDEIYDSLLQDFVYNYLVRHLVVRDADYEFYNVGIIHDTKNNTLRMSPNYDFEYTFRIYGYRNVDSMARMLKESLNYIYKNHNGIYNKFLRKFDEFRSNKVYRELIEEVIGKHRKTNYFIKEFETHLDCLDERFPRTQQMI